MKKSFMTRILATGLSFAMAFSMAAATNVTTASAAVKKASVTSFMKASSKTVVEGKTVTTYMKSNVAKKYRIKKHTESTVAKKYISVENISSRKGLKITAKEGALAAANLEKKGVNVKIYFAPGKSAAAAKKATATKYVNLKVVVTAKPVEKLAMTAAATGVKKITVTFNKAVDTSKATIALTKGTAKPTVDSTTWSDDSKSVVIATGAKLTKGTYTVTVTGLQDDALVQDIVAEDETLKSFDISKNLIEIAHVSGGNSYATVSYKALNQYGEMMAAPGTTTVNCTFGTVTAGAFGNTASANKAGDITVTKIPDIMAIQGTTGTIVIVDSQTGVSTTSEVTYSPAASATTIEFAGFYNINKAKFEDISNGATIANYQLLMTVKDQYGNDLTGGNLNTLANANSSKLTFTAASGLTNITTGITSAANQYGDTTVNGVDYVVVPLAGVSGSTASTGTVTFTVVNSTKGLVATQSYDVAEGKLIKNFSIDSDVAYAGEDNSLTFTALDQNGEAVTDYATLVDSVSVSGATWKKQADGSAKLIYHPATFDNDTNSDTDTTVNSFTIQCNLNNVASNYVYLTDSITVKEARVIKSISGIKKDAVLANNSGSAVKLYLKDIIFADQYSNEVVKDDNIWSQVTTNVAKVQVATDAGVPVTLSAGTYTAAATDSNGDPYITVTPNNLGSYALYLAYSTAAPTAQKYDYKTTITGTNTSSSDLSDIKIAEVNGGNVVKATSDSAIVLTQSALKVTGIIAGKTVQLPYTQYEIKDLKADKITSNDARTGVDKKTGSVTIIVSTYKDGAEITTEASAEFTYQLTSSSSLAKLSASNAGATQATAVTAGGTKVLSAADFQAAFTGKDQFGDTKAYSATDWAGIKYTATVIDADNAANIKKVTSSGTGTNACKLTFENNGIYQVEITATLGDTTLKPVKIWFKNV